MEKTTTYDETVETIKLIWTASDNAKLFIDLPDEGEFNDASDCAAFAAREAATYAFTLFPISLEREAK